MKGTADATRKGKTMLTAAQARLNTEESPIRIVLSHIEDVSLIGKSHITYKVKDYPNLEQKLSSLGYTVTFENYQPLNFYEPGPHVLARVSW